MTRPPDDLPPSAKFVATIISDRETCTRQALLRETGLKERTFDDAISRLVDAGLVSKEADSADARRITYEFEDNREYCGGRNE